MKVKGMLGMALAMAMMSDVNMMDYKETPREYNPKPKKNIEPQPKNGQFHYWFRADGTFLNEKQDKRMRKDECVFKCFAINNKNAIKKFKSFANQIEVVDAEILKC